MSDLGAAGVLVAIFLLLVLDIIRGTEIEDLKARIKKLENGSGDYNE